MTVAELIEKLSQIDPSLEVIWYGEYGDLEVHYEVAEEIGFSKDGKRVTIV